MLSINPFEVCFTGRLKKPTFKFVAQRLDLEQIWPRLLMKAGLSDFVLGFKGGGLKLHRWLP